MEEYNLEKNTLAMVAQVFDTTKFMLVMQTDDGVKIAGSMDGIYEYNSLMESSISVYAHMCKSEGHDVNENLKHIVMHGLDNVKNFEDEVSEGFTHSGFSSLEPRKNKEEKKKEESVFDLIDKYFKS